MNPRHLWIFLLALLLTAGCASDDETPHTPNANANNSSDVGTDQGTDAGQDQGQLDMDRADLAPDLGPQDMGPDSGPDMDPDMPRDACAPNPCMEANRSICQAGANNTVICSCDPGFQDDGQGACIPSDLCNPNPCIEANRSVCQVGANDTIICSCDQGFRDENGTCVADPCNANTCVDPNKTQCNVDGQGNATCSCDPGFEDDGQGNCVQENPCAPNPCGDPNRTTCQVGANNTAICACDMGYRDDGQGSCVPLDPCTPNPCMDPNKTQCSDVMGQAICACDPGFQDDGQGSCIDPDPCDPNPCMAPNQTQCSTDMMGAVICGCDAGFQDDGMGGCQMIPAPTCTNQHSTGDMYEPDECPSLATPIAAGDTQNHSFDPVGDRDFYSFTVQAGEILEFRETTATDGYYYLYDTDGTTVLRSTDSESMRWEFTQAGTYYFAARHYSSSRTGNYTISVTSLGQDDHGDDIANATQTTIGQTITGSIETFGDYDVFAIPVQAGHIYEVRETSTTDVYLRWTDDMNATLRAQDSPEWMRWEFDADGITYLFVRHYSSSRTGDYTIEITDLGLDDHGDDYTDATPITLGQDLTGQIETYGDYDVFSFTAQAGHVYRLEETSASDVYIRLRDPQGNSLRAQDSPEWIQWEFAQAGTYFFEIRNWSSTRIGSYTIKITDLGLDDHGDDYTDATPITLGQDLTGQIETYGDYDVFSFTAQAGHVYRLEETSASDVYIRLQDDMGNYLRSQDSPEWIQWEFAQAGTYFFVVRNYSSSRIGSYTIKISDLGPDDHGDTSAEATTQMLGDTIQGTFETYRDRDVFALNVTAGQIVRFAETTGTDTTLNLYDTDGTTVLRSITSPETIVWEFTQAGTYFLSINHGSTTAIGTYTLVLEDKGTDDQGDNLANATTILTDGTQIMGEIQYYGDADWYSFTTGASQIYAITISGSSMRVTLYDSMMSSLGSRTNGTLTSSLNAMQTYYLRVDGSSSTTLGNYSLSVSD